MIFKPGPDDSDPRFAGYSVLQSSSPFVTDWDADGDLDLVVGMIGGKVFLLRNTGTPRAPDFAAPEEILAGGESLKSWLHKSGPWVADWDGDGLRDLVIGEERGVWWCRNAGKDGKDDFAAPEKLLDGKRLGEGYRYKPCVADWNGDGLADLVVGTTFSLKEEGGGNRRTGGNVLVFLRERAEASPRAE